MTEPTQSVEAAQAAGETQTRSPPAPLPGGWERIKEHKVLQWGLGYLGASLAVAHGAEILGHTFHWSPIVGRLLVGLLIVGFPIALALAWYHGHKGLQAISKGEMAILSALVLIGAGLLTVFVKAPDEPHAATTVSESAGHEPSTGVATESAKLRIAILPFENLSPDPGNAFFTDGLHEEITSAMANRGRGTMEVISRTTMMIYRTAPKAVPEIARELGATHVLEGSVRRDGDDVRLTLQLIDARRDEHIWTQNFDRKLVKAMTLQSEVANEVASQLAVRISGGPTTAKAPTTSPEAYDLYLKARVSLSELSPGMTPEDAARIPRLLDQAIALDREFGWAYALRSIVLAIGTWTGNREAILASAHTDLETAKRLIGDDPRLLVYEADLLLYENPNNPAPALAALDAAEAAGVTDDPHALQLRAALTGPGQMDESLRLYKRAVELDPVNLNLLGQYQIALQGARKPREALRVRTTMAERWAVPFLPIGRALLIFDYTGRTEPLRASLDKYGPQIDANLRLGLELPALRFERRFKEFEEMSVAGRFDLIQTRAGGGTGPAWPLESLRGYAALLTGNEELARKSGRALMNWTKADTIPGANPKFIRSLAAEAQLLMGDKAGAIAAARQIINQPATGTSPGSAFRARNWRTLLAVTLAWAGAEDDAVDLLEQLAIQDFGLAPAEITRDPLFDIPLANNARYKALSARLEAQMTALNLQ